MLPIKNYPRKYTGCYRCPDPIKNFKIRIKVKEVDPTNSRIKDDDEKWIEKTFKWQEKVFSRAEKIAFSEIKTSITELEKRYNQNLETSIKEECDDFLFSYTDEDTFEFDKFENVKSSFSYLENLMESLEIKKSEENLDFDIAKSILNSIECPVLKNQFYKMHIMADFGEYFKTTWIERLYPICTLKFEPNNKMLHIYPDFTKKIPYLIKIDNKTKKTYQYFIENASEPLNEGILMQEQKLFKKLINNQIVLKKNLTGKDFYVPPKNKLFVYIFAEILTARNFEYADIYVKYYVDLPEHWTCQDTNTLYGITQVGCGKNDEKNVHFGYNFELVLEYNIQNSKDLPRCPTVYFEIISKDSWKIYRNEGVTYKILPINQPGTHKFELQCFRFGKNDVTGDLRRFFVGDCGNYDDVTWVGRPKNEESRILNKFGTNTVGTGSLKVRLNVLHQSQAFLDEFSENAALKNRERLIFDKLKTSSLLKSVEEVVQAFKRARKNMLEARKQI